MWNFEPGERARTLRRRREVLANEGTLRGIEPCHKRGVPDDPFASGGDIRGRKKTHGGSHGLTNVGPQERRRGSKS